MIDNKSTTSIARKINMDFWLKLFSNLILLDIVLIISIGIGFFMWRESVVPSGVSVVDRDFSNWGSYARWTYTMELENGKAIAFQMHEFLDFCKKPAIVLGVCELLILFSSLFYTKNVRRIMSPLNDIAVKAEELSNMSFDSERVHNFEKAINEVEPDGTRARVVTGDKELQSLEIAINNMLDRIRESHKQQERFVSDASHELRTPIAVIQGYANMLDRWGKDDEQILQESIEALKNESEHMKELVDQLLFLARGDNGRNTLNKENFDLARVVAEVCEESAMIDNNHKYVLGNAGPVIMNGDIAMIKQSIRIMVQNAAKYSQSGQTINLKAAVIEGKPAYVVQDEGLGMSKEEISHVFERFYRSDSVRNSSEGGTGLGLSIAKWIVDAHEGVVDIISYPEFGTRFTVKFS